MRGALTGLQTEEGAKPDDDVLATLRVAAPSVNNRDLSVPHLQESERLCESSLANICYCLFFGKEREDFLNKILAEADKYSDPEERANFIEESLRSKAKEVEKTVGGVLLNAFENRDAMYKSATELGTVTPPQPMRLGMTPKLLSELTEVGLEGVNEKSIVLYTPGPPALFGVTLPKPNEMMKDPNSSLSHLKEKYSSSLEQSGQQPEAQAFNDEWNKIVEKQRVVEERLAAEKASEKSGNICTEEDFDPRKLPNKKNQQSIQH